MSPESVTWISTLSLESRLGLLKKVLANPQKYLKKQLQIDPIGQNIRIAPNATLAVVNYSRSGCGALAYDVDVSALGFNSLGDRIEWFSGDRCNAGYCRIALKGCSDKQINELRKLA